jgi:hypothetical protein
VRARLFCLAFFSVACMLGAIQDAAAGPLENQRFICNTGYSVKDCVEEIALLKAALAAYPVERLGAWTWVLVKSADWKEILRSRGLNADSPAFSFPERRQTFLEEALFVPVPQRSRELLLIWNLPRPELLNLAVTHELGHCLCNDGSEANANRIGGDLRKGTSPECKAGSRKEPRLEARLRPG